MSRRSVVILISVTSIVLVLAAQIIVAFVRYSKVLRGFASVHMGESRAVVITKIGKPNYYEGKCGVIHFPDQNCALEYVYSHPFAPILPTYYIVSFSPDDRVIEADWWDSP